MTREPYRSLWEDPPQPDPYLDVVVHRVIDEDEPEVEKAPRPRRRWPRVAAAAVAFAGVLVALAASQGDVFRTGTLPSAWEDVPMRCDTARIERGDEAVERFSCRATQEDDRLPAGLYSSPDARWTSDFTRREARANAIVISRDGELHGVAVYQR